MTPQPQPSQAVSGDKLVEAIVAALKSYRCSKFVYEEDGDGMALVDMLTPPGIKTIAEANEELDLLADHIASELADTNIDPSTTDLTKVRKALEKCRVHMQELEDAWVRGSINESDGRGGERSNRNSDVLYEARSALALLSPANAEGKMT